MRKNVSFSWFLHIKGIRTSVGIRLCLFPPSPTPPHPTEGFGERKRMFQVLSQEDPTSKHSSVLWKCVYVCVCLPLVWKCHGIAEHPAWQVVMATRQEYTLTCNQGCVFQRVNDKPVTPTLVLLLLALWSVLIVCNHHRGCQYSTCW